MTPSENPAPKRYKETMVSGSLWQRLTAPLTPIEDLAAQNRAPMLSGLQLLAAIASLVAAVYFWNLPTGSAGALPGQLFAISAILLMVTYGFSRTNHFAWAARISLIILMLPVYVSMFSNPPADQVQILPMFMWLIVPLFIGSVVLSGMGLVFFTSVIGFTPVLFSWMSPQVSFYDVGLIAAFLLFSAILTNWVIGYQKRLESGKLTGANHELEEAQRALSERNRVIETSAEISRYLSAILDPEELVVAVVEQIKSAFGYYHAHIYLLDDAGENLVMAGGTGQVGRDLLAQNHKIALGTGVVGQTAVRKQPMLIADVHKEPNWLPNVLLPDTLSEVAVPITQGEQLVGVLDVQNREANSFGQSDVALLVSIAHQVTIGLHNAALFKKQQQATLQLEEEKESVKTILGTITIPVFMSSIADGKIIYVNDSLSQVIRIPREQLIGEVTPDFYVNPADRQQFIATLREQGFVKDREIQLKRGDGELFWALGSAQIIAYEGQPVILTSFVDIHNRILAEAQMAKLANELRTVAEVSVAASTLLEPTALLQEVTDLTKTRFGLYHAHILLLNEQKNTLVLMAGAGEIGRQMVAEGRQIPMSAQRSLIATVARNKEGAIRNYSAEGEGFMPHPLLAETRSEMAVPIMLGADLLGVLDVRSEQHDYFSEADMQTQTTLASQVAVALQNARSFTRSEQAVKELQDLSRRLTREGWDEYLAQSTETLAFQYDLQQPVPNENGVANTAVSSAQNNQLTHPLQIQGEPIGELKLTTPKPHGEDAAEIVTAVAERLSTHLENLRLTEQSERARSDAEKRSQEMEVLNSIVTRIAASLDLQHSLQIIVDELVTAVQVDQVRVALLSPDKLELLIIAERYDQLHSTSALGATIPVVGNTLTEEVIASREMAVIENALTNPRTAPVHELFRAQGIETFILIPLVVNDEVLGTIGLDILDKRSVPQASLQLAETIVYQAATAIQNARLFEQTQAALAEIEMLYAYSSQLNTATNLEMVLDSAAAPGFEVGAMDALLLINEQGANGHAEYGQIVAATAHAKNLAESQRYLPQQPLTQLWPVSGKNIAFVGDISQDDRLSEADKASFQQMNVQALAIMFLMVGNLRLGQIVIRWNKPQTFTTTDERLYGAIAQQASSVVYNRLLFNQTEEALSETAALYQASTDLNAAQTFEEVLTTLRQHTILGQGSNDVTLNYFSQPWDKHTVPDEIEILTRWGTLPNVLPTRYKLSFFPEVETVLTPNECLICEDVATDERMSEKTRAIFSERFKAKSAIYVPLVVGGQWVGFISGIYPQPMQFPEVQVRRLNVLGRQAVVSIQSIRLFEQTQAALAETEALYIGSERIVLSNSENDILHGLIQSTMLQNLDRANIFMFDEPVEDGVAKDVTAVAIWENVDVPRTVEVGTRFRVEDIPFMKLIEPGGTLLISDVRQDPRVDAQTCQVLEGYGMRSFVLYPLVAGNQWLGMVSGQSARPFHLDDVQIRKAISLVSQASVVLQTMILFRQEQARARREQLLREIATKVRSSTDVDTIMRTAVTEIGRTLGRRSFIKLGNSDDENGAA